MSKNINDLISQLENDATQSNQRELFCNNARQTANYLKNNIDNLRQASIVASDNTKNAFDVLNHASNLANTVLENKFDNYYDLRNKFDSTRYDLLDQINSWYIAANIQSQLSNINPEEFDEHMKEMSERGYNGRQLMLRRLIRRKDDEALDFIQNAGDLISNTINDMNTQLTTLNKFVDEKCSQNASQNLEHLQDLKTELQKMNDDNMKKQIEENMKKQIEDEKINKIYDSISQIVDKTVPIMQLATKILNADNNKCNNPAKK